MNGTTKSKTTGKCLCGKVRFAIDKVLTDVSICHCEMCRRWSGSPLMAIHNESPVTIDGAELITWFESSDWAERGFCRHCGSNLFYRLKGEVPQYIVCAGALDDLSALELKSEIFIDEKPAFYGFSGAQPRLTGAEFIAMLTSTAEGKGNP